uniref:GPI transamidase component PIG-S isoform X2 n=1 Tax=Myxine glutinosa TaxID=7769 RepID=UPI00358F95DD
MDESTGRQRAAACAFVAVALLVGLPVWLKTTQVYRATLPLWDIERLASSTVKVKVPLHVAVSSQVGDYRVSTTLQGLTLENREKWEEWEINVREMREEEEEVVKKHSELKDLTAALTMLIASPPGEITVFVCPRPHTGSQSQTRAYLGTGRGAVVWVQSAEGIEEAVTEAAFAMTSGEGEPLLAPSLGYDLSLTLLVPDPLGFNVSWNIEQGVEAFLLPFLSSLSPYILFNVTSQVVYCVGLGVRARYDSESGYHVINEQQLSHAISPLEAKLGAPASLQPQVHLVVYIPERETWPISLGRPSSHSLLSLTRPSAKIQNTAALLPGWGGLQVYNGELSLYNHTSLPVNITIEMKPVVEVFISQLRSLLGLWPAPLPQGMAISPLPAPQLLADWEKDTWLRRRTISTITMATGTLSSLANTLNTISNIVIDEDIGKQISESTGATSEALNLLASGELSKAWVGAADGFAAAESAFFNPSLLALLSFPDDQKFAIYIPLFLPAAIPLLVSLKHLVLWCRKR